MISVRNERRQVNGNAMLAEARAAEPNGGPQTSPRWLAFGGQAGARLAKHLQMPVNGAPPPAPGVTSRSAADCGATGDRYR
jgi:hypothetical protein